MIMRERLSLVIKSSSGRCNVNKYCRLLIQSTDTVGRMWDWADLCKKESQWPGRDYKMAPISI